MSDPHAPDPIDKAYAEAEAMLSDEAARAARRARVLAAVADAPAAESAPPRRPAWQGHGGWLAAACVAGVSVLLATRYPQVLFQKPAASPESPPAAAAPPQAPTPPPVVVTAPPSQPERMARADAAAPQPAVAQSPSQADIAAAPRAEAQPSTPLPPPPPPPPPAPAAPSIPPLPVPPVESRIEEIVVTGSRRTADEERERPKRAAKPFSGLAASRARAAAGSPADLPDRIVKLHAAAAAGRTSEVEALLGQGLAVDAPDSEGETALMKSIQGGHRATAALLRRRGASLDLENRAGVSARTMARAIGDAKLNRALGLDE